jgi:hypothetical protein
MGSLVSMLTPTRSWSTTNGTIDSCEWVRYHDHLGGTSGHYQVKFSYQPGPGGPVNHGEFCHEGMQHIAPYRVGESLPVQYDPRRPQRHRFKGATPNYEKLEAILVMTVFALVAGYVLYAY